MIIYEVEQSDHHEAYPIRYFLHKARAERHRDEMEAEEAETNKNIGLKKPVWFYSVNEIEVNEEEK